MNISLLQLCCSFNLQPSMACARCHMMNVLQEEGWQKGVGATEMMCLQTVRGRPLLLFNNAE